jgi:hypothetical protein
MQHEGDQPLPAGRRWTGSGLIARLAAIGKPDPPSWPARS